MTYEGIMMKKLEEKNYNPSENIMMNIIEFSEKLK